MPESSPGQLRLRRSKDSERRLARWLQEHDGPDPVMKPGNGIVSETGRVGHVTALQFDAISLHYAAENKQEKVPATWWGYWKKIVEKAGEWDKEPLLRIEPTNDDKYKVPIIHIITEARHQELLDVERWYNELREELAAVIPM